MDRQSLIGAALVTLAVGGVMYAVVYPYLSGDIKAQKRTAALMSSTERRRDNRSADPAKRRKMIQDSLKDIETKAAKKLTLEQRIAQAGLKVSRPMFMMGAGAVGLVAALGSLVTNGDPLLSLGVGVVVGVGLPHWLLGFLAKRRVARFIEEFPGSVDIIIRGIKAGLPVADCFRMIATEAAEPVRSEFRQIVESQTIGLSIGEATERFAERMPVAEASFFSIVISLQEKSGGNLSEALGNLAGVLRERKKMKAKVRAMSAEAKASAGIIGSLPFLVGLAVWFTNQPYMAVLFNTTVGNVIIAASLLWMAVGVFIMKNMIDFEI
ncbi:MAG TPA: type II secretion system F family protein [Methylosinus sp.]